MPRFRHRATFLWLVRALVVAWPLAHLAITVSTPRTSWKLGGFGMYAEPHFSYRRVVVVSLSGVRLADTSASDLAASQSEAFERFTMLAGPDDAARLVAELDVREPVLVLLAVPHADVDAHTLETWHEIVPFVVAGESVVPLRPWSTQGLDTAAVDARIAADCDEARHRLANPSS
jgi:hypothetical protein